jgi:hypothetical protein
MAILTYKTNCRGASSVANAAYILREDACAEWETHNLEEVKTKEKALSYVERRAWEEDLKPLHGTERRNHQRLLLTFPEESNPKEALENAKKFLKQEFPNAKAILSAHTNTANLHVHIWLDVRQSDGKKIHLTNSKYKTMDDRYAKFCDEIYGTNYAEQFKAKKLENINNRELLKSAGKENEIVRKQNLNWKNKKQGEIENEQRSINIGKYITTSASGSIDESSRRINELKQLDEHNRNEFELASIGRAGMERKRNSNDQSRPNSIHTSEEIKKQSGISR